MGTPDREGPLGQWGRGRGLEGPLPLVRWGRTTASPWLLSEPSEEGAKTPDRSALDGVDVDVVVVVVVVVSLC